MNAYGIDINAYFELSIHNIVFDAGINMAEIGKDTREREFVEIRQAIMALAYINFNMTLNESWLLFMKNHATAYYSSKRITDEMDLIKKSPKMPVTNRLAFYIELLGIKNKRKQVAVIAANGGNKKCMGFRSSNLSAYIELN